MEPARCLEFVKAVAERSSFTVSDFINVFAVFVTPFVVLWVTRRIEESRAKYQRRYAIFRTLMSTRRMRINAEHVTALNLIEVEFIESKKVMDAWKAYLADLAAEVDPNRSEEQQRKDEGNRDVLLTKLIFEVGRDLKIDIEQLDILKANHIPQGWENDATDKKVLTSLLTALLRGQTSLRVRSHTDSKSSPFPPPPPSIPNVTPIKKTK